VFGGGHVVLPLSRSQLKSVIRPVLYITPVLQNNNNKNRSWTKRDQDFPNIYSKIAA
jgi:hypothetical protein